MDWGYWVFLLSGLAVGAVLGWMVHKARSGARIAQAEMAWQAEQSTLQERLRGLELHREQLQQEISTLQQARELLQSALRDEGAGRAAAAAEAARLPAMEAILAERSAALADLQRHHAELVERLEQERRSSADKLALLDEARLKLADAFQTLSADALRQNNQSFLTLAGENLKRFQEGASSELEQRRLAVDQLVQPIRESLAKVDGKLADLERERLSAYSGLKQQLTDLAQVQIPQLRAETQSLVKALRQPAARGRWGEMQLKRVVEMAGML
ncbi:MAG: DNA recombination protein RmuC, partial [Acidithiobacillus sp.]